MSSEVGDLGCREAARRLHELLDRELTADVEAAVRRHIEACADCMAVFEFEQAFKRFLALQATSTESPLGLKQRILGELGLLRRTPES